MVSSLATCLDKGMHLWIYFFREAFKTFVAIDVPLSLILRKALCRCSSESISRLLRRDHIIMLD